LSNNTIEGGAYAEFFIDAVEMKFESVQAGRPIFKDFEFVRIFVPGDAHTDLVKRVTDVERDRFPTAYAAFKRGQGDDQVSGTPLSVLPWLLPSQIKQMQALNIRTVEHLAGLSDTNLQTLGMGARELKAKAQAFIDSAEAGAEAGKYAVENETLKAEIEALKQQIKDLADQIGPTKKR